ncbi:MAG: J domain-containing protein [Kofleriaceae bacterium]
MRETDAIRQSIGRGELVRLLYRLGRDAASGMLTLAATGGTDRRREMFVLRRGQVVVGDTELAVKALGARLARLASFESLGVLFEPGVAAYPPGSPNQLSLVAWARRHVEAQLDGSLAEALTRQLAGARLSINPALAPEPADDADRRMLAAMAVPRRLDQIWPLARTPRFRLLAFLHFLRTIDALEAVGVVVEPSVPTRRVDPRREAARRMLGIDDPADLDAVKRAYRRLVRTVHPDLHPDADDHSRQALERRFVELTAAYDALR